MDGDKALSVEEIPADVLFSLDKGKLLLEAVTNNYRELSEINKHMASRVSLLAGAFVTGFGLVMASSSAPLNSASGLLALVGVALLGRCGWVAATALGPQDSKLGGLLDHSAMWQSHVYVTTERAYVQTVRNVLDATPYKIAINSKLSDALVSLIRLGVASLIAVTLSEVVSGLGW